MPPGVGLPPIEAAAVQRTREERTGASESTTVAVTSVRTPQSHPSTRRTCCALGRLGDRNLDDQVEHGVARPIRFADFRKDGARAAPAWRRRPPDQARAAAPAVRSRGTPGPVLIGSSGKRNSSRVLPDQCATDRSDPCRRHRLLHRAGCPF